MSAVLNIPFQVNPLREIQKEYQILELGGKFGVIRGDDLIWKPSMTSAPSLMVYQNNHATIAITRSLQNIAATNTQKQVIADFWADTSTQVYKRVAFSPKNEPNDTLNLWIGPTTKPTAGHWQTIELYLKQVLCAGDKEAYIYLIQYLAHMLQKPEEKPGVMIVLLGGQGIGKGTFEQLIRKMFAATTVLLSDVDSVIGRFNSVLERAYAVFMDEALFVGDKKSTERLKSFITSTHIQIEEKHQPERAIESYHRFFAASNNPHFAHIDHDDRRMFYLKVSNAFKGKTEYWGKVYAAIEGDEVSAMVYDLLAMDLSKFNVRIRPNSNELVSQKIDSLPPFHRFWFDCLWNGEYVKISASNNANPHDWEKDSFWQTKYMLEAYEVFSRSLNRYSKIIDKDIAAILKEICPSSKKDRKKDMSSRGWGYVLPAIDMARTEFDAYLNGTTGWPDLT